MYIRYEIINNFIELSFSENPPQKVTNILKNAGWKWDEYKKIWIIPNSDKNLKGIRGIVNQCKLHAPADRKSIKKYKILNVICNYTDYNLAFITITKRIAQTCCNGVSILSVNKLLKISDGISLINVDGGYCPRCHHIYFKTADINNSLNSPESILIDKPFITVKLQVSDSVGNLVDLCPVYSDDNSTYKEKYGKNLQMYLIFKSFVYGKDISIVDELLKEKGYSLDSCNKLPVSYELNDSLYKYFNCDSMDELCFLAADSMKEKLNECIKNGNIGKIYFDYNEEKNESSVAFSYKVSDDLTLVFNLLCSDIYGEKGNYSYNIIDKTIKVSFKCKKTTSKYIYPVKDDTEGYNSLIKTAAYKQFKNNVKMGIWDDSDYYMHSDVKLLDFADFLVRSTSYGCTNNNHKLIRINAAVKVKSNNNTFEVTIPAAYCEKCDRYYILEKHYDMLKKYGYICCKIDTFESLQRVSDNMFSTFQEKSILSWYGYNVNQQDNLSENERHRILDLIIENGIQTSFEVINRLEQNISLRKNNSSMKDAIKKWEIDIEYVRNNQKVAKRIKIKSISLPVKRITIQ